MHAISTFFAVCVLYQKLVIKKLYPSVVLLSLYHVKELPGEHVKTGFLDATCFCFFSSGEESEKVIFLEILRFLLPLVPGPLFE